MKKHAAQQVAGISDEDLSLEAAQQEGSRKVSAGARAAFATVDGGQAIVADPSMARINVMVGCAAIRATPACNYHPLQQPCSETGLGTLITGVCTNRERPRGRQVERAQLHLM